MHTHCMLRWPGGKLKAVTLSYDDGQRYDRKMVEIMDKYGIKGTFNLNSYTDEKHIQPEEYNTLYKNHEIAIHGREHVSGSRISDDVFAYDIISNRKFLEEKTGKIIKGMAYANGTYDDRVVEALKSLGVKYSRTTKSTMNFELPENWLTLHPTCHHRNAEELIDNFLALDESSDYKWRMFTPKMLYIWGHSYEFERENNWDLLERICEKLGGRENLWYATNVEIYDYVKAFESLEFNLDMTYVYNPTATDIWFKTSVGNYFVKAGEAIKI